MTARRDQALAAFGDEDARYDQLDRIEDGAAERRDALLELELTLGLPSPADLAKERLAVQVRKLNSRFKAAAGGGSATGCAARLVRHARRGRSARPRPLREDRRGPAATRLTAAALPSRGTRQPAGRHAMTDPFDLQRFVDAQRSVYPQVCAELAAGCKRSHWMWFVFRS